LQLRVLANVHRHGGCDNDTWELRSTMLPEVRIRVEIAQASRHMPLGGPLAQQPPGPTVVRLILGAHLRRLRQARGISAAIAGQTIRTSHTKISNMERGRTGFDERDVADLLTLYGVTDEHQRAMLLALAQQANTPGWAHQYHDLLSSWEQTYLVLEQASSVIRTYYPQQVPDLLQIPEVARATLRLFHPSDSAHDLGRRVAAQMTRQEILTHRGAPRLWAVIDQAMLARFDESSTMRDQIRHLIIMAQLPHVTLQMLPIYSGEYVAISGPLTILRFAGPDLPDSAYLQQHTTALHLNRDEDVQHYRTLMDRICVLAKSPAETIEYLKTVLVTDNARC
jgi:hypothetical protein